MPTVARIGPYRFFFYSNEGDEPPHVHVRRERRTAKFWLLPVHLARSSGFSDRELGRIRRLVDQHRDDFREVWHEFFGW